MFDYETNASTYFITVQAKDEYNASVEGNFTVTVLEAYEPFTNVATEAGITTGGTGAWGDFDNDGDVDLFVSSNYMAMKAMEPSQRHLRSLVEVLRFG